ncbi:MAG: TrkA family potassium uptake protein [Candidatus Bipolaricaulota bacterium]|jgi:trk system potassium uptake protein TrkA|nr:TrkA family potassium uptake protein [Candidatus Bipolaricaulota bacterium]
MFVLIVGGGKTGSHLAELLLAGGHRVAVIDRRPEIVELLRTQFPPEVVVSGDGADPKVLVGAGIKQADVLAAVTADDEDNLVVSTMARFEFAVRRVIARVNDPKNAWLFTRDMGVDVALNQADLMAKLIVEEMSIGDMMTLLKLRRGQYSLVEEKVDPKSPAVGKAVRDLDLPCDCVLAAIIRKGDLIIPRDDTVLQPIDEVLAIVRADQQAELNKLLSRP